MMTDNKPTGETREEGSDIPPVPQAKPEAAGMEICVPIDSLAMPGQDEKMNNPGVGDPVQAQVEGTVSRIEGESAYVSVKTVNGKPVTPEAAKTSNTPGADENGDNEFAQLQSDAAQQPRY